METFVLGDVEDIQVTLKFEHREENGEGVIKVYQNGNHHEDFARSMVQLAEQPITFYVILNNQINKVEYGCGHDNPGVYLKTNEEHWDQIPTTAADEKPPEFQRGEVLNNFNH